MAEITRRTLILVERHRANDIAVELIVDFLVEVEALTRRGHAEPRERTMVKERDRSCNWFFADPRRRICFRDVHCGGTSARDAGGLGASDDTKSSCCEKDPGRFVHFTAPVIDGATIVEAVEVGMGQMHYSLGVATREGFPADLDRGS